jgi:hypothetical protein
LQKFSREMTHFWQNSDCSEVNAAGYWPLRGDRCVRSGTPRNRPTPAACRHSTLGIPGRHFSRSPFRLPRQKIAQV